MQPLRLPSVNAEILPERERKKPQRERMPQRAHYLIASDPQ